MSGARTRFKKVLQDGDLSDGLPILEWVFYWDLTVERWEEEGLPKGLSSPEIWDFFGLDKFIHFWQCPRDRGCPMPPREGVGIIRDEATYDEIRPLLYPEFRLENTMLPQYAGMDCDKEIEKGNLIVWFTIDGPFWHPRMLLGIQPHLFAFYEQPRLMKRIIEDHTVFTVRIVEEMCQRCQPDIMVFAEDMSYNSGPMISPDLFEEFLTPYYREVTAVLRKQGIIPFIDSDGGIEPLIPLFQAAGIAGILPLERSAGVDVNRIRRNHPDWRMVGGFDKHVIQHGEEAMRAEFERIRPAVLSGRYVPSMDHQTPPSVSLENYRAYVALLKEFSEEVAREARAFEKNATARR